MVRVMMLAPFLIILSTYLSRGSTESTEFSHEGSQRASKIVVPWFALGFVAVAALNSLRILPHAAVDAAVSIDTIILAMAMAALGLTTRFSAIRTAGIKPLALAALLFGWLILGGVTINAAVTAAFR
jgi:uncharacterized integral membrane protein (TIGR00698 family)